MKKEKEEERENGGGGCWGVRKGRAKGDRKSGWGEQGRKEEKVRRGEEGDVREEKNGRKTKGI